MDESTLIVVVSLYGAFTTCLMVCSLLACRMQQNALVRQEEVREEEEVLLVV
jgi:hypothetical protein